MRGMGSPVLGSWLTRLSKRTPATTPEGESFTSTGFIVLMSADDPSITRPPATGLSTAVDGEGDELLDGACVHAVATSTADARAATNVRMVLRLFMCPPLAFCFPLLRPADGGRVYPAAKFAAAPRLYGRVSSTVHFWIHHR